MYSNAVLRCVAGLWFAAALGATAAGAAPRYVAVPLPDVENLGTVAVAINSSGEIAGYVVRDPAWYYANTAFRYAGGSLQELDARPSSATGISDDGQVVAWVDIGVGKNPDRTIVYSGDSMRELGRIGGAPIIALGVSPDGQATGYADLIPGPSRAFRYADGNADDLGTLGGAASVGFGINRYGEVTGSLGWPWPRIAGLRAFVYSHGEMRELGTLGGDGSTGHAINALGQVTGDAITPSGIPHAFLYDGAAMVDLGSVRGASSLGFGINVRRDVVGVSETDRDGNGGVAFLYTEGKMYDLNSLVVSGLESPTLFNAAAINDHGQIAATGYKNGREQAYRLDPVPMLPVPAIEYHHAAFDHYFVTASPDEIAKLDGGVFSGWSRTGESIMVFQDAPVGTGIACRFFSASFAPKSSHFYTTDLDECRGVRANADWIFESIAFNVMMADAKGDCPPNSQPVYRLYNKGEGGAPNHRFTTSEDTRTRMLAAGWVPEGAGTLGVGMCAPR